jgi:hypothetical protein
MSKRRPRPKLGLNLAEVNKDDTLDQSFMVQSDAFVNKDFRVGKDGMEIMTNTPGEEKDSPTTTAPCMSPIVEGKVSKPSASSTQSPTSRKRSIVGDMNPSDLEIVSELGRGASSYVQLVRDKKTQKEMALKVINVFDKNMRQMLLKEIHTLYKVCCY